MYDLILRGGTVVDGTRSRPYAADVCIRDGRIARITPDAGEEAREVVDVSGLTVAPGFIDIHSHSDACPLLSFQPESKLFQGITTEITGNCGTSILPSLPENSREIVQYFFDDTSMFSQVVLNEKDRSLDGLYGVEEYARAVAAHGCTANYGQLVGHGTLRGAVMGFVDRDPGPEEMERLKDLLERELRAGAFGMSLGLIYPPSAFCKREELVELAKVLKKYDALLTVHMRNEGPRIFQAVDEMLDITRRSGVHLQISHLKLMGRPQWGRSRELLDKLAAARRQGLNVTCDQYPYTATSTSMTALLPKWAHDGGRAALLERLRDPSRQLKAEIAAEMEDRGGADRVMIAGTHGCRPEWEGRTVAELTEELKLSPADTVVHALDCCGGRVACIYFSIDEGDMLNIMKDMDIAVGSDGYGLSFDRSITITDPHPRSFGTFPRFLRLVREHQLMPLEDAVYKLTGLPADILGLRDRGTLAEGRIADITVFDAERVRDTSEFTDSVRKPEGICHVLVGGEFALRQGRSAGGRKGAVIRRESGGPV
ncbi:amidohydrolase family protein [Lawsonibacter asaccharolyticus]